MKKIFKFVILLICFCLGLSLAFARSQGKTEASSEPVEAVETEESRRAGSLSAGDKSTKYWVEQDLLGEDGVGGGQAVSNKFSLVESQAITADKNQVETGENVVFSTAIKNEGSKMKHLTHLCFNHSGGVTFGCLEGPQGPNLDSGQEFPIGGATIFTQPGTYQVWLTWSQDATNFYRPLNSSSIKIVVE
jgi:hypothetical protein